MVGQSGKAGTEEYSEEFGFITKNEGTRVRVIRYGCHFCFHILILLIIGHFSDSCRDDLLLRIMIAIMGGTYDLDEELKLDIYNAIQ